MLEIVLPSKHRKELTKARKRGPDVCPTGHLATAMPGLVFANDPSGQHAVGGGRDWSSATGGVGMVSSSWQSCRAEVCGGLFQDTSRRYAALAFIA